MSNEYSSEGDSGFKMDAFIPLVLLSIGVIVLLGWQVKVGAAQTGMLQNAITRQEPAINQSTQVQNGLAKLANDLLEASQTDDTAKAIAAKYIKGNSAAGAGAGATAAPAAASPTP